MNFSCPGGFQKQRCASAKTSGFGVLPFVAGELPERETAGADIDADLAAALLGFFAGEMDEAFEAVRFAQELAIRAAGNRKRHREREHRDDDDDDEELDQAEAPGFADGTR